MLFNKTLHEGVVPNDWKEANIVAIFKKGTRSDPGNYRPVSLTSIVCKVLESLIRDVLVNYFNNCNLYSDSQHGFRQNRSCMTQLLEVMEELTLQLDNKHPVDMVYLDFRKAFDSVPHERLILKLKTYGISGNLIKWIRSFLSGRTQVVKIGKELSSKKEVTSGIPQGSILGPVLFTVFINDLPEIVSSSCKVFADDTKIYNSACKHISIQNDLDKLFEWSNIWQLHFNIDKCKVLHLGNCNPLNSYCMNNIQLHNCSSDKDLGIFFDSKLCFDNHINYAVNKANSILSLIKRSFTFLDKDSFLCLYKSLVRPHLEYGNIIWYPLLKRQSAIVERVQRRATKMIGELKNLSYKERLIKLRLPSLKARRVRGDLIYVYKIINNIVNISSNNFFY